MADKIPALLAKIEAENKIKILFAVESGSRVWGMDSPDSDFDIRGIFISTDPITRNNVFLKSDRSITIDGFTEDRVYDWVFWDVTTFLRLVKNNNPTAIDWMLSDICYTGEEELLKVRQLFLEKCDLNYYLVHHYGLIKSMYEKFVNPDRMTKRSLDSRNFLQGVKNIHQSLDVLVESHSHKADNVINSISKRLADLKTIIATEYPPDERKSLTKIKKILYACRSAISIEYMLQKGQIPPLDVTAGFEQIEVDFDRSQFKDILQLKRRTKELEDCMCPDWVTSWYQKLCKIMVKKCIEIKTSKKIDVSDEVYVRYYLECSENYPLKTL